MNYLDHNATSPILDEVWAAMEPWVGTPANPASAHRAGQAAAVAVEQARDQVAALVGGVAEGVVFTSGATEANHLFVRGAMVDGGHLVHSAVEHPCVGAAADVVRESGAHVSVLPVDEDGRAILDLPPSTTVLSLMAANHETGVLQPIDEARSVSEVRGALMHVDATQAAGRVPLSLGAVDGVVLSSHKLGGPGGTGALVLRDGYSFPPLFAGSQERGRRGGTVFVAGVVGFGAAASVAARELKARQALWEPLRATIEGAVRRLGGRVVGDRVPRIGNTVAMVFPEIRGESVVQALDLRGVCVSAGAACASGSLEASPTLLAMGDPQPDGIVRVSMGPATTPEEIEAFVADLEAILSMLSLTAGWDRI